MARTGIEVGHDIVNLVSDSEDEGPIGSDSEIFDAFDDLDLQFGPHGRQTIDLTAIPDIDVGPSNSILIDDNDPMLGEQSSKWSDHGQILTEAVCLQMVLGILPDISVEYALKVIQEKTTDVPRTAAQCEQVVTYLLDLGAYPKEADEVKKRKRKRGEDDDLSDYEKDERDPEVAGYEKDA